MGGGVGGEHAEHPGVLVAERELDGPVLRGLEAARVAQHAAELHVLGRRERREHRPLLGERALDVLDARDALQRGCELVVAQQPARGRQLVQHQLQPQLRGLVLDDEQQLVVVLGIASGRCADSSVPRSR